jgi:2-methylcitrate dehydratase PrpD
MQNQLDNKARSSFFREIKLNSHPATAVFADYIASVEWDSLDDFSKHRAHLFLHDSLAVGIAGTKAPFADALFKVAAGWGRPFDKGSSVLGRSGMRLPAPSAAFVNAYQIHGQEFDCVHEPAVVHPLATIVAVLLAEVDRSAPCDGRRFLTALCTGVDVSVALGLAATSPLKFFRPATAGIFGCVAALAKLRGASREDTINALGYGLAFASGTMQAHLEGLPTLPIQIAAAARSAIQAMDLAQAGIPGPKGAVDGPFGYLSLFEDTSDLASVLKDLGTKSRISEVSWKPFPTGRAAHGGIVATQRLVSEHGVTPERLIHLTYCAPPLIHRLVGRPAIADMTPAYARLCLPYLASLVLRYGTVGLQDFTAERLHDPDTLALAQKITVTVNDNSDPAAFSPALATAALTDAAAVEVLVSAQLGSPALPLTYPQHLAKAQDCLTFAGMADRHQALTDAVMTLADALDVSAVLHAALYPKS